MQEYGPVKKKSCIDVLIPEPVVNEEILRKEKIAKNIREADEKKQRNAFLVKNDANVKRLERSIKLLSVPRLPPHHVTVDNMDGHAQTFQMTHQEKKDDLSYRYCNLFPGAKPPKKAKMTSDGALLSYDEVLEIDRQSKLFKVSGRHHQYEGKDRIFPLKHIPKMLDALYPVGTPLHMIEFPEDKLLPNDKEKEERLKAIEAKNKELLQKVPIIKESKLNLSRAKVNRSANKHWNTHTTIAHFASPSYGDETCGTRKTNQQFKYGEARKVYDAPSIISEDTIESDDDSCDNKFATTYNLMQYDTKGNTYSTNVDIESKYNSVDVGDGTNTELFNDTVSTDKGRRPDIYHSTNSIRTGKFIPINFERKRGIKGLDRFEVKKLKLVSLKTKLKRQKAQRLFNLDAEVRSKPS